LLSQENAIRQYNKEAKQRERKFEKALIKFYAWQRYPGESWHDFKRRFWSVKILIDLQALSEQERQEILSKLNNIQ